MCLNFCPVDRSKDALLTPFVWVEDKGYTFVYVRHANVFLVAATRLNSNAAMLLSFLFKLIEVFQTYFKDVQEESIRDNFVIIYELLDEMMDFGYPQVSESKVLREYITQDYHVHERPKLPMAVTNAVSWRNEGIRHLRNEVFLDVIEKINMLIARSGNTLRSEIVGKLIMKS